MDKLFAHIDRRYAKVCLYAGITVVLTLATCMLLYTASPVFATIWQLICAVVEPIVYGAALSYVLNPLVSFVSRMLRRQPRLAGPEASARRRSMAVVISLCLVAFMLILLAVVLILMVTHSLAGLRWDAIQRLLGDASGDLMKQVARVEAWLEDLGIVSAESEINLLKALNGVKNAATSVVFAVIFAVYFLIDGPRVTHYLGRVTTALFGTQTFDPSTMLADADHVFSGYFRGQGIDAAIVGALSGVALTAVGVPYGPVIGLLAGLGNMIPYVGGPVGFGSVVLMCLPSGNWRAMVAGVVVMVIVMFVDGNIINPRLLSDNVEVHPILVLVALIAGGAVGGIAGMLVAVPLAAFLKIQLDRWLAVREEAQA